MTLPGGLVALETSGPVGSVAVSVAGDVRGVEPLNEAREHASRLVPALAAALERAGLARADVQGVVVGSGPGSFTGVRVAAAAGKGLAHALGIPLWAVSSLDAAAPRDDAMPPRVWVLFDARGRRLFGAAYERVGGRLERAIEPRFLTLDEVLSAHRAEALACAGTGAWRHRDELLRAGVDVLAPPLGTPTAEGLLARLAERPTPPVEDVSSWEPDYLRDTGAVRARRSPPGPVMG